MTTQRDQDREKAARALARRQHGTITRQQLLRLGFSVAAIRHRVATGRLFPVFRGVYAWGRGELSAEGWWMAGVLACGDGAALSHESAGSHYAILGRRLLRPVHVSVPAVGRRHERRGIAIHRRGSFEVREHRGIPVTTPECTIVDLTPTSTRDDIEAMINAADIKGLTDPERLRASLDRMPPRPGKKALRLILDVRTFRFTRSGLERAFIPIALRAGLPRPLTRQIVNGSEVDFYWPELGLVVETDGLTYHRTPQQQAKDLQRDQKHVAAGLVCLRFSHGEIRHEPERVERVLREVLAAQRRKHAVAVDL
jgi:very-short-patch-repair endonuclease